MGKLLKEAEINRITNEEKVKLYELENARIQEILNNYWDNKKNKKPNFSSIKEEISYLTKNPIKRQLREILLRLRGKYYER